jgi:hypothetical protein
MLGAVDNRQVTISNSAAKKFREAAGTNARRCVLAMVALLAECGTNKIGYIRDELQSATSRGASQTPTEPGIECSCGSCLLLTTQSTAACRSSVSHIRPIKVAFQKALHGTTNQT